MPNTIQIARVAPPTAKGRARVALAAIRAASTHAESVEAHVSRLVEETYADGRGTYSGRTHITRWTVQFTSAA